MYELEEGEILGRHAGQGVEVGACPIENPDVVDIVDAASMELEGGFIRETWRCQWVVAMSSLNASVGVR